MLIIAFQNFQLNISGCEIEYLALVVVAKFCMMWKSEAVLRLGFLPIKWFDFMISIGIILILSSDLSILPTHKITAMFQFNELFAPRAEPFHVHFTLLSHLALLPLKAGKSHKFIIAS